MGRHYILQLWYSIWKRKVNIACIIISIGVYCLNQLIFKRQFKGIVGYFCKCHLNDLVCPLFFLAYAQILLIWVKYEVKTYIGLLFLGMSAGFVWEYLAPIINPKAVTDIYDLFCYFCGIQIYYFFTIIENRLSNSS